MRIFRCSISLSWAAITFCTFCNTGLPEDAAPMSIPTMSYARPVPIIANGEAVNLGHHSTTRCYDWDADGDLDVICCEERANLGVLWYENPTK